MYLFVHCITSIILSGAEREAAGKLLYTGGTKAPEDATLSITLAVIYVAPTMGGSHLAESCDVLDLRFQYVV